MNNGEDSNVIRRRLSENSKETEEWEGSGSGWNQSRGDETNDRE